MKPLQKTICLLLSTMSTSIRLLILETDTPLPPIHSERGGYAAIFQELLRKVGGELSPPIDVHVTPCYVVGNNDPSSPEDGALPDISECATYNGVLITGSKYDAHGNNPWILKLVQWIQGRLLFRRL
jgi:hypothetical protein